MNKVRILPVLFLVCFPWICAANMFFSRQGEGSLFLPCGGTPVATADGGSVAWPWAATSHLQPSWGHGSTVQPLDNQNQTAMLNFCHVHWPV